MLEIKSAANLANTVSTNDTGSGDGRNGNLDIFRALAALSVVIFHFNAYNYLGIDYLYNIFRHGFYGVHIFFVISGYVVPLLIYNKGRTPLKIKPFLQGRFFRLYPAYIASFVLMVLLGLVIGKLQGKNLDVEILRPVNLFSHLTLTADFIGSGWYSTIYWSLAIELQFYLLIGVCMKYLLTLSRLARYSIFLGLMVLPVVVGVGPTVFSWTALFLLGIVTFMYHAKLISRNEYIVLMACSTVCHMFAMEPISGLVGLVTALLIAYLPPINSRFFIWLGTISYSIYLLHIPIGSRFVNLTAIVTDYEIYRLIGAIVAIAVTIVVSYLFYRFIESPSQDYGRKISRRVPN